MKKIIVFAMLLIIATATFSQQTKYSPALTKQDYLQKSKNQKKVATIMLLGGATFVVAPFFIFPNIKNGGGANFGIFAGIVTVGLISMPASIPFFISSSRYKKKGMNLSFKNETAPQIQKSSFVYKSLPSLTLKISL